MTIEQTTNNTKIEPKPRWILSVRDLPQNRNLGRYRVSPENGDAFVTALKGRKRQVVDAMINGELFCASTVRIGDAVFRLKEDNNLRAETKALSNGRKYYTLQGSVEYLGPVSDGSTV